MWYLIVIVVLAIILIGIFSYLNNKKQPGDVTDTAKNQTTDIQDNGKDIDKMIKNWPLK